MALTKNDREVLLGALVNEYLSEMEVTQFADGKEFPVGKNLTFPEFAKWVRDCGENHYEEAMFRIRDTEDAKTAERIEDYLNRKGDNQILLKDLVPGDYDSIVVRNLRGFNSDERSHNPEVSGFGEWIKMDPYELIDKERTVFLNHGGAVGFEVNDQTTIRDLVRLILYVKGSRFDRWYEMFSSITPKIDCDIVYFDIKFDHGS